jgi:hypothetical protein
LQLPGYSSYLQPLDATHLLGVGRDGDHSLKIALYDVSDPTAPRQVDVYDISGSPDSWPWATQSAAEYDPHALSYFPETHTLALPVSESAWAPWLFSLNGLRGIETLPGGEFEPAPLRDAWGLDVFQVDLNAGFHFTGRIDQDSPVQRSLQIGDTLYSVATDSVKAVPIDDPTAAGVEARLDGDHVTSPVVFQSTAPLSAAVPSTPADAGRGTAPAAPASPDVLPVGAVAPADAPPLAPPSVSPAPAATDAVLPPAPDATITGNLGQAPGNSAPHDTLRGPSVSPESSASGLDLAADDARP